MHPAIQRWFLFSSICFLITPNVTNVILPSVGVELLGSPPQATVNVQFNLLWYRAIFPLVYYLPVTSSLASNQAVTAYNPCSSGHSDLYLTTDSQNCRVPAFPTSPSQPLLLSGQSWTQPTARGNSAGPSFPAGMRLLFLLSSSLLNTLSEGYQSNNRRCLPLSVT